MNNQLTWADAARGYLTYQAVKQQDINPKWSELAAKSVESVPDDITKQQVAQLFRSIADEAEAKWNKK